MSLRIQTNIPAVNAHRQLSVSSGNMAKSLERLSSGYRINRAADDAAGLAIAGKLRTNVRSFIKASENTAQATSMVQVAEGGINQIENIVNRLKELATQAGSTNTDADGRARLNDEFSALMSEVNRIAQSTKYGETYLLKGTFGATAGIDSTAASMGIASANRVDVSGHIGSSGSTYTITDAGDTTMVMTNGTVTQTISGVDTVSSGTQKINFDKLGISITLDTNYTQADLTGQIITVSNATQNVQVGTRDVSVDRISMAMADMQSSQNYGCSSNLSTWTVDTVSTAQAALNSIDTAINYITQKRGDLGALQNRLGYAAANLATTIENTSAAESTIRDVDMAMEMSSFTKSQILMQAGTAMLAQANMAPQQVLGLFG